MQPSDHAISPINGDSADAQRVRIAIYDMDKTITVAATWMPFLIATARARAPWRLALLPVAGLAVAAYAAKLIDRGRLKEVTQRLLTGGATEAGRSEASATHFADRVTATGVYADARARIAADRAAGYRLVMATASYRFYAASIAGRLGFDAVIATGSRIAPDGRVEARIDGENCYGPAKLRMIEAWLLAEGIARDEATIRFYSDHVSDAVTLEWVDEPFVVNPHPPLRAMALVKGWDILDWR